MVLQWVTVKSKQASITVGNCVRSKQGGITVGDCKVKTGQYYGACLCKVSLKH